MRYIKTYEEINTGKPEIGDFVYCKEDTKSNNDTVVNTFLYNNIGRIARYRDTSDVFSSNYPYVVKYEDVPENKKDFFAASPNLGYCRAMSDEEIVFWSKNKEDITLKLAINKYNI